MCQHHSRYMKCDAERRFGYKVMTPLDKAGYYESVWYRRVCRAGKELVARGETMPHSFEDCGMVEGGAFHVFTRLEDARDALGDIGGVIVRVAVADYVASGIDGVSRRTACYLRMQIEEEVC